MKDIAGASDDRMGSRQNGMGALAAHGDAGVQVHLALADALAISLRRRISPQVLVQRLP
jgi:hypothetical protein